jgi:hypothetical protein
MLFLGDQIGTRAAYSTAENPAGQRVNFFDEFCPDEFHPDIHGENKENREFGRSMQGRLKAVRCKTEGARRSSTRGRAGDRRIVWAQFRKPR